MVLVSGRAETGPIVIVTAERSDDWPGIFIRGDQAYGYASLLQTIADMGVVSGYASQELRDLAALLRSCDQRKTGEQPVRRAWLEGDNVVTCCACPACGAEMEPGAENGWHCDACADAEAQP